MEIAGVSKMDICSSCACSSCTRGNIHPLSTHDCPRGKCSECSESGRHPIMSCPDKKTN